jgi:hypothetical protein
MGLTIPCTAHRSVKDWYSQPTLRLRLEGSYARHVAERRRKVSCSRTFAQLLTNEDRTVLSSLKVAADESTLEEKFREQADKWDRETQHLSSPMQMMTHPSYQAILGMAQGHEEELIRFMLRDLRAHRRPWFWALSYFTKENPIKPSDAGKLDKMIRAWVDWGKRRSIL